MATLKNQGSGRLITLEYEHTIGRSPRCALHLSDGSVSAQHAAIRWNGHQWEARDLGSLNGTLVDGQRLDTRESRRIGAGVRLLFGNSHEEWELTDAGPPTVMLSALDGDTQLLPERDLIGIPSSDDPQATAFCGADGRWRLEQADAPTIILDDQRIVDVAGRAWRFSCPALVSPTTGRDRPPDLSDLSLELRVSRDEEHVEAILGGVDGGHSQLGTRGHNYLLLLLARTRLEDAARNLPETSRGWVDQEEITRGLATTPEALNLDIFRIRRQFARLGMTGAANIIERRPRAKQMRIGIARLVVTPL